MTTVNGDEVVILAVADVQQDEVSGVRVIYQATTPGGLTATVDRQILTDDRHTAVYEVRLFCDIECFESNAEVIDEIMETFTVEVG